MMFYELKRQTRKENTVKLSIILMITSINKIVKFNVLNESNNPRQINEL